MGLCSIHVPKTNVHIIGQMFTVFTLCFQVILNILYALLGLLALKTYEFNSPSLSVFLVLVFP